MIQEIKNISKSVHQRLLNKARESSRPFNELLQYFIIERFIHRLSRSRYRDNFVLKGALMLSVWKGYTSRPTKDIDLLGSIQNDLGLIHSIMKEVCTVEVVRDGIVFEPASVSVSRIIEDSEYEGVRVLILAAFGTARIPLQIDIGFGDAIIPGPRKVTFPGILDFPPFKMNGYSKESAIAEKFQIMVKLGIINSRMKDFYDIWMLSHSFDFQGESLCRAIKKTFIRRNTAITASPSIFDPSFARDSVKNTQWKGFINKSMLRDAPENFTGVITAIKAFLEPIAIHLSQRKSLHKTWIVPGPWR